MICIQLTLLISISPVFIFLQPNRKSKCTHHWRHKRTLASEASPKLYLQKYGTLVLRLPTKLSVKEVQQMTVFAQSEFITSIAMEEIKTTKRQRPNGSNMINYEHSNEQMNINYWTIQTTTKIAECSAFFFFKSTTALTIHIQLGT